MNITYHGIKKTKIINKPPNRYKINKEITCLQQEQCIIHTLTHSTFDRICDLKSSFKFKKLSMRIVYVSKCVQ